MSSVFKATIENKTTSATTHFFKINDREQQQGIIVSVIVLINSHAAVFKSNVQFVRLAAERPTQAGDATDQWRDR